MTLVAATCMLSGLPIGPRPFVFESDYYGARSLLHRAVAACWDAD